MGTYVSFILSFVLSLVADKVYSSNSSVRAVPHRLEGQEMLLGSVTTVIIRIQILQTIHSISRQ